MADPISSDRQAFSTRDMIALGTHGGVIAAGTHGGVEAW